MPINCTSRQLRAFLALAEARNFTRAAAAVHLSQPAFSAVIRQFEDELGLRLFDRSTRHVALTAEGEAFAPGARRVLAELDAAVGGARDRAEQRRGQVSIALLPSLAADWLPGVLASFQAAHPGIEVRIEDVLSEPCIEAVRAGRADLALAATRVETPELRAERFCADAFHLVGPARHPLLAAPVAPRPAEVAAWPFIHLARHSSVRQVLDAAIHPRPLRAVFEVEQLATVAGMIRAGLGVSIVPALALQPFRARRLATRPLDWPGLKRHLYLVRRRDRSLSRAAEALVVHLQARAPGP